MNYKHPILLTISTALKYLFAIGLIIFAYSQTGQLLCLIAGLMELAIIFLFSNSLIRANHILGWIVNGFLLLLLNIQMAVLTFGNTYISLVMMTNLDSVKDLSGQAVVYISAIAAALVLSFIPARHVGTWKIAEARLLSLVLAVELIFTMCIGSAASPLFSYYTLIKQQIDAQTPSKNIVKGKDYTEPFHGTTITGRIKKPEALPEQPNVIAIFTEGLSQNIVTDSRNIMPNVAAYEKKSINFTNYFNHTFATYRALSGQLYSGYQKDNYDSNALISLQDMGFDEVISDPAFISNGIADSISDKDAYELLFDTVEEQAKKDKPFFTAIYTFGTHTSLDSPDEKFGDESDSLLNKFYNLDYQFGAFMEKYEESDLAENTIIFFTADHAAYQDRLFKTSFPDYERKHTELDEMPFFIYYKGITPQTLDVEGRNTLDFAPTVLDYLDISTNNYFLGTTLFSGLDNNNNYDTIFTDSSNYASTRGGEIRSLTETERDIIKVKLDMYYEAKQQGPPETESTDK